MMSERDRDSVLSPSDVATADEGARIAIGGRVTNAGGSAVVVADAFGAVFVSLREEAKALVEGSLAVVRGTRQGSALVDGTVESTWPSGARRATEHERMLGARGGRNLQARAAMFQAIRSFFGARAFLEVDTPQWVPSPGLDLHLDAFSSHDGFLITSPEYQMKRLLVAGLPRIFQIVHCFRRGEQGDWHNPEFSMLEWYRAFSGIDDLITDTTALIAHVAQALTGHAKLSVGKRLIDATPPYEQLTICEAFERFAGVPRSDVLAWAEHDEDRYFRTLVDRVEPALATLDRLVVLRDYPASQASLARTNPRDPAVCERFELYAGGVELCNGFGELTDPAEQRFRFDQDRRKRAELGKPAYPIDESFLNALQEGMPPSGGNALGLDRLLALCLGTHGIGAVMPFPADRL